MRLYGELADLFLLVTPAEEYAEEAGLYERILTGAIEAPARTVLELGSGAGNNASHMKARFDMTLVEPSPQMRALSESQNPECEHTGGDMRTVRLERTFDGVFVHDAVVYMTSEADLRKAIETAFVHCRPGGAALFVPDHVRDTFRPSTDHGGSDGEGRSLRYLEWTWDPDPSDTTYTVDYVYMLRGADGEVRVEHDRHLEGLFARADWLRFLADAGFRAEVVPFEHSELDPGECEIFLARRPGADRGDPCPRTSSPS